MSPTKILRWFSLCCASLLLIVACQQTTPIAKLAQDPISIAFSPWPGNTTDSLYFTSQLYTDFFAANGFISTPPDLETLINPTLLKALQSETAS